MNELKTVSDIREIQSELIHIFPDSIRASESKSNWFGNKRKKLILTASLCTDTVYAYIVIAKGGMLYFIDYDSNDGYVYKFAESNVDDFIKRMIIMFYGQVHKN